MIRTVQRKCDCGGGGAGACAPCEDKKKIQRKARGSTRDEVPRVVDETLAASGVPLDDETRVRMEQSFHHDFSSVRIHVDASSARAINARAYTAGSHIVFGDHAGAREPELLAHELTHVVQQRSASFAAPRAISEPQDLHEREADSVATRVTNGAEANVAAAAPPVVSREVEDEARAEDAPGEGPRSAGAGAAEGPPPQIVEDDARDVGATQMRKTEFLDALSAAACEAADAELARVGRSTEGCPYVERALAYYRRQSAERVERAIRIYANASHAGSARDYIPIVATRIGEGVARWASTGEVSGIPPELAAQMPAMGLPEMIGAGLRAVGGFIGRLFGKAANGTNVVGFDAAASNATQVAGAPLDTGVRTRMERAFGDSFTDVRVHTGADAAGAATRIGARAYTVGSDVAFAGGEYQPGTPVGDALIAHELAHVVQQRGATTIAAGGDAAYEEDADTAATGAMVSMWSNAGGTLRDLAKNAGPRLRSGLRLSRCSGRGAARTTVPAAVEAVVGGANACGSAPLAPSAATTEANTTEPELRDPGTFGETARPPANAEYGATQANGQWTFCITQLAIPVRSAVRPESFKTVIPNAESPLVTAATWGPIARDLRPTATGSNSSGSCLNERIVEPTVPGYSRRNTYWNRDLVIQHEAFHRTDWVSYFRPELVSAETDIRAHTLAADQATSASAAVSHEIVWMRQRMITAYMTACRAYTPLKETRAYADGRQGYLDLVQAIRDRARTNQWNYPRAEIDAP